VLLVNLLHLVVHSRQLQVYLVSPLSRINLRSLEAEPHLQLASVALVRPTQARVQQPQHLREHLVAASLDNSLNSQLLVASEALPNNHNRAEAYLEVHSVVHPTSHHLSRHLEVL
jgi:hypothetical protein